MWGAGWGRGGSSSDQSEAYPKQHPTACGSMALRTRGEDGQSNPARNKQRRLSAGGGRSNKKTRSAQLSRRQERRTVLEGCCCGRVCPWAPGGRADSKAAGKDVQARAGVSAAHCAQLPAPGWCSSCTTRLGGGVSATGARGTGATKARCLRAASSRTRNSEQTVPLGASRSCWQRARGNWECVEAAAHTQARRGGVV